MSIEILDKLLHLVGDLFELRKVCLDLAGASGRAACGRSSAEIVGSNPTEGTDVCLL
jgi:hypothetical protein